MAAKVRVTARTDTRGTVNADFRGAYQLNALEAARKAGIPGELLHPAGFSGDENDLTGYFAELIYRIGEVGFTDPAAIERLAAIIGQAQDICRNLGVDPRLAIPYGHARFIRQLHESYFRGETRLHDEDSRIAEIHNAVMAEWGAPTGPPHDDHGHGKTPDGWRCASE
jgi:hypothetical protein